MSNLREVNVLLKRIRELEAELGKLKETYGSNFQLALDIAEARAEKAEARVAELERIQANMTWNEEARGPRPREREAD